MNFETIDKREVLGIIAIHVDDMLISGGIDFTDYISCEMKENSRRIDMWAIRKLICACGLKK